MPGELVLVRGGGDLGSGVSLRLWRAGFTVGILEVAFPTAVRRSVCFSEAVYDGVAHVEEATGYRTSRTELTSAGFPRGCITVVVDEAAECVAQFRPAVVVDAVMAKRNTGTSIDMARCVVALGPGFQAGVDVHAVVETNRGPHLGRVIWSGAAAANTGTPGAVEGKSGDRVLRAPTDGVVQSIRVIGDTVHRGELLATVGEARVLAPFNGLVRGLLRPGTQVTAGNKIGDLDPRTDKSLCTMVSDKSLAVAGGVMEAVFMLLSNVR